MNKKIIGLGLLGAVVVIAVGVFIGASLSSSKANPIGSTQQGSEYQATTTRSATGVTIPSGFLINNAPGTVGSVVITGATTGTIDLYDIATTTSVLLRGADFPTSTLRHISIPASTVAGTYTFDVAFTKGIYLQVSGTGPTSTITYR